jgi:hypothetical protein
VGDLQNLSLDSKTLGITSEGVGEIFQGYFADMCPANFRWGYFFRIADVFFISNLMEQASHVKKQTIQAMVMKLL